jgi:hypothetical protein
VSLTCFYCKVNFSRIKRDVVRYTSRGFKQYCSHKCRNLANRVILCCKNCLKNFEVPKSDSSRKFCGRRCSATYNNIGVDRHSKKEKSARKCVGCDKIIEATKKQKYCSLQCHQDHRLIERVKNKTASVVSLKRYLIKKDGRHCSRCKNEKWNGIPICLEIEHIDGDSENNELSNLQILCPNCHAQTPTYKGKNKGNGRHSRRIRYKTGKSF